MSQHRATIAACLLALAGPLIASGAPAAGAPASIAPASIAPAAGAAAAHLAITGFQSEDTPTRAIRASAAALTTVGVDGTNLIQTGAAFAPPDSAALAQLDAAHRAHLRAELRSATTTTRSPPR